jgi:hypothetical protein
MLIITKRAPMIQRFAGWLREPKLEFTVVALIWLI